MLHSYCSICTVFAVVFCCFVLLIFDDKSGRNVVYLAYLMQLIDMTACQDRVYFFCTTLYMGVAR